MKIIGHRGASLEYPENTIEAIKAAYDLSADGAECDVTVTKDGNVVLIHDDDTIRTCPSEKNYIISETEYSKLKKLDVGSWKDEKFKGIKIPLIEKVIKTTPKDKILFVEVKSGSLNQGVNENLKKALFRIFKGYEKPFKNIIFISFDHDFLNEFKRMLPDYKMFYLTESEDAIGNWIYTRNQEELNGIIKKAKGNGIDGIDLQNAPVVKKEWIESIKAAGLESAIWSYRKDDTIENAIRYKDYGVDYLKTDDVRSVISAINKLKKI